MPPWTLNGLSDRLIVSHYENHYGGAVRRLNAIAEQLESLDFDVAPAALVNGLKREELVAMNAMLLHELSFGSLGGDGKLPDTMRAALNESFGCADRWRSEFVAMGKALAGGSGWALLVYLPRACRLVKQFAADHSQNLAGGVPLLALDMYEHAYHSDFGANPTPYIDAIMRNLDWSAIQSRYLTAIGASRPDEPTGGAESKLPSVSVEAVNDILESGEAVQLIDARPRHYYSRSRDVMVAATWRDPDRVEEWMGQLSRSEPVLVYCAYGFHVGCSVTAALRAEGFDARYIEGGLSAWKAIGGLRQPGPDA